MIPAAAEKGPFFENLAANCYTGVILCAEFKNTGAEVARRPTNPVGPTLPGSRDQSPGRNSKLLLVRESFVLAGNTNSEVLGSADSESGTIEPVGSALDPELVSHG